MTSPSSRLNALQRDLARFSLFHTKSFLKVPEMAAQPREAMASEAGRAQSAIDRRSMPRPPNAEKVACIREDLGGDVRKDADHVPAWKSRPRS